MTHRLDVVLADVPATITSDDEAVASDVARLWGHAASPSVSPDSRVFEVHAGTDAANATALLQLATDVNAHCLTHTPHVAFHAAVVTRGAHCVVICASSGTGKSTLTVALLQRGWSYVSDEALCLDAHSGRLVPYPRPIGLLPWSRSVLGVPWPGPPDVESLHSPTELGAGPASAPERVTDVVVLARTGRSTPLLQSARRQFVASEVLRRSFNHFRDPAAAFTTVHALVAGAHPHRLDVGTPAASAEVLESAVLS